MIQVLVEEQDDGLGEVSVHRVLETTLRGKMTLEKGRPPIFATLPLPCLAVKVGFQRQVPLASTQLSEEKVKRSLIYTCQIFT